MKLFTNFAKSVKKLFLGLFFVMLGTLVFLPPEPTLATPNRTPATESSTTESSAPEIPNSEDQPEQLVASCNEQVGPGIAWLVCPTTGAIARAIDSIYTIINDFLVIKPLSSDSNSSIYLIWEYFRNLTNLVFIIFILLIVYSQLTGIGIDNYGIKKTLPRIIIAAVLVNLSFSLCSFAVDASNIIGVSLRGVFSKIAEVAIDGTISATGTAIPKITWEDLFSALTGGTVITGVIIGVTGGIKAFIWVLAPILMGALVAIVTGLITIAARQAVVALLVMISPLAFVAYLLPNTEPLFVKWRKLLTQMLVFYPVFSLLFGASELAGWAIISSASNAFSIILGMGVQVFPLIFSWSLMKMSDTVLGTLNSKLNALLDKPKSSFRDFANEQRNLARSEHLAKNLRNPTGIGGALAARFAQERAKRSDRQRRADDDIQMLTNEQLIARKLGTRIIGYSKSGKPIYSSRPITGTKEMYEEFKHRETKLRTTTAGQQLENTMGAMGTYLQQHQIDHSALTELVEHQAQNYLDSETEKSVAKRNALSDKRFYFKQVQEAAKAGPGTAAYRNLIERAAGADFHVPSHLTGAALAEAQKASLDATTSVIADAYDMFEAERRMTTAKYTTYLDKQVTKDVFSFYDEMLKTKNVDGVVAAQNVIAIRGDYDQIHKKLGQYLDQEGYLELAEDFTNTLALNLMSMKDEDPALARLGKHINVETWQYTSGKRKSNYVTLKEFFTGVDSTGRLTKFNVRQLMRGTNLNKIDRTFYGGLLDNMNTYFTAENFNHDTDAAKDARIELLTGMLPQIIGALPSFTSGSEQIINTMSFLTGMKYDNEKNEWVVNPEETPERSQESFLMTENYLNALTPNDLINMKTDAFNAVIAKLTAHHNGDEFAAIGRFREIAESNNNIERLKTADSSALTTMKESVRKALGI